MTAASAATSADRAPFRGERLFRVVFGVGDPAEVRWDGELVPDPAHRLRVDVDRFRHHDFSSLAFSSAGRIVRPRGEAPIPNDHLREPLGWVAATREAPLHGPTTEWHVRSDEPVPVVEVPSILVWIAGPADVPVAIHTAQGDAAFTPSDLAPFASVALLDGRVRVEALPPVLAVAPSVSGEQDRPAVLAEDDGALVAWQEYDDEAEADAVLVRHVGRDGTPGPTTALVAGTDVFGTAIARDDRGRSWVVWSEQRAGRWSLYGAVRDPGGWTPPRRLTDGPGNDVYHRAVTASDGRLWLAWQRVGAGGTRIFAMSLRGDTWSGEVRVDAGPGNAWWPAVAAGPGGSVVVAWDAYGGGSYDVHLRRFGGDAWDPPVTVAGSPRFEAHPSVAVDRAGRVWVAWDESGEGWGKDTGFLVREPAVQLHESRRIRVACLAGGRWWTTAHDLADVLPPGAFWELPHLAVDATGAPVLLARRLVMRQPDTPLEGPIDMALWEIHLVRLAAAGWTAPVCLPRSTGRNEMLPATSAAPDGTLWATWATDGRDTRAYLPHRHAVHVAALVGPAAGAASPPFAPDLVPLEVAEPAPATPKATHRHDDAAERAAVARVRGHRIESGGRTFRILRGDLHRHTDVSLDGANDGSLLDAYRYALDAAAMDFVAVTDHTDGVDDPYAWWRTQKVADIFQAPGRFAALYAYERSVEYPNGHRNVFFARRGARITPINDGEHVGWEGSENLYRYLRHRGGFAIPHTTGRTSGTDWRDNDPAVEPLVEIYQGMRDTYEDPAGPHPYAGRDGVPGVTSAESPVPRASSDASSPSHRRAGFVSAALAKGYRLGFVAASDHVSTHVSYACLVAESLTPEGLLEAALARRAYAATDNIVLDVRLRTGGSDHLMGSDVTTTGRVTLTVRVIGTAAIAQLDLIRDGAVLHSRSSQTDELAVELADEAPPGPTPRAYYVRVVQADGGMAWGSPIWVHAPGPELAPGG